jgi:hypothetical protein
MRIHIHQNAGEHTVWDPHAFDNSLNKSIPLLHNEITLGTAKLVAVSFTHNYRTAILTIEVNNGDN